MRLNQCYRLLNLEPDASLAQIKAQYRKLAFHHHPDLHPENPQAATRFAQLNEAYVTLKTHLERTQGTKTQQKNTSTQSQKPQNEPPRPERPSPSRAQKRQEEILKDILNDPFAKEVFEDILQKLRGGRHPTGGRPSSEQSSTQKQAPQQTSKPGRLVTWLLQQLSDRQTIRMPARTLVPGSTIRISLRQGFGSKRTVDITLPQNFQPSRPLRLRGMGRKVGKWKGDLYLSFIAE